MRSRLEPCERREFVCSRRLDATFPEYDEWYAEALQNNWGWGDYEPARLADAFRAETAGPPNSGNGKEG